MTDTQPQPQAHTATRPDGTSSVEVSISIDAAPEVVFEFLTVPELAFRWMGIDGELDPTPGGVYRVRYTDSDVAVGEYVEITPHTTVSWTWGWDGDDAVAPGSTLVTFSLTADEPTGPTVVTVSHTGLPDVDAAARHGEGWSYWVGRLATISVGGELDGKAEAT